MTGTKFRWCGPTGQKCELFGDVRDWTSAIPMPEVKHGVYECTIFLSPGIYRYKFRLNNCEWIADKTAACDPTEGCDNSLIVVGGSSPPLYFAPDRGHVAVNEDGTVRVHVENDGHHSPPVFIDGMRLAEEYHGERHGRRRTIFHGKIDHTADPWPDLRVGSYRTSLPKPRSKLGQPPVWAKQAVFYAIFIDRWHRGKKSPPDKRMRPRNSPSMSDTFFGGDLWGVAEGLDYLKELGIDAIVLTPVQTSPSPHHYDGIDLFEIDKTLGGEEAFNHLLGEAHRRGIRVVADVSITHIHEEHPLFQSVLSLQRESPYCDWFYIHRFPVRARDPDCLELYPTESHLPWLNLHSPQVREYVFAATVKLVRRGVDGLRLDAMTRAPNDFWYALRKQVRLENPEILLLGEVVTDRPAYYAEERGVDMATDFTHREAILDFFRHRTITAEVFVDRLSFHHFRAGPLEPTFHLLFLDNHDTDRFLMPDTHFSLLRLALTYLLLRPEPIWINYGTEMAVRQDEKRTISDGSIAIPERMPMPELQSGVNRTQQLVRDLLALRHRENALQGSGFRWIHAENRVLVFDRFNGPDCIRIAVNTGHDTADAGMFLPASAEQLLQVEGGMSETPATLAPRSAVVIRISTVTSSRKSTRVLETEPS